MTITAHSLYRVECDKCGKHVEIMCEKVDEVVAFVKRFDWTESDNNKHYCKQCSKKDELKKIRIIELGDSDAEFILNKQKIEDLKKLDDQELDKLFPSIGASTMRGLFDFIEREYRREKE